eukprot:scaffold56220_cov66-Phaeocystis_antarctica.AAC.5
MSTHAKRMKAMLCQNCYRTTGREVQALITQRWPQHDGAGALRPWRLEALRPWRLEAVAP